MYPAILGVAPILGVVAVVAEAEAAQRVAGLGLKLGVYLRQLLARLMAFVLDADSQVTFLGHAHCMESLTRKTFRAELSSLD
jgi:hypothetical protein